MELIRKNIHMNKEKCRSQMQITLDNDINVPDVKPDIESIVREQGYIKVNDVKAGNGRVNIRGELVVNILYISGNEDNKLQRMVGTVLFDEQIIANDVCEGDNMQVSCEIDDLSADIINSRKVSIKSIIRLTVSAEEIMDEEAAVTAIDENQVEQLNEICQVTELALSKKDTYRIKEEITIPSGRDSIRDILYQDITLEEVDTRMTEGQLSLRGELKIFILYSGVESDRINPYDTTISFSGTIDCSGCKEGMIPNIGVSIQDKDMLYKEDEDGEDRIIDIEVVLGLDMKVYREEEIDLLTDMYSTSSQLIPVYKDAGFDNIIIKNNGKSRINERIMLDDSGSSILQMCNVTGNVRIDEEKIVPGGIAVEGIIEVKMLYFTDEDNSVIGAHKGMIPFSHFIEVKKIHDNCVYDLNTGIEQISAMVIDGREVEIKATVRIDVIVFEKINKRIIVDCKVEDNNLSKIMDIPGMTGYIVGKGDTLWSIAKEFSTTRDVIRQMNGIADEDVKVGDKLLLVKQVG